MKRSYFVCTLVSLIVLSLGLIVGCGSNATGGGGSSPSGAVFTADIYVSPTGSDEAPDGDGTLAKPYKTIQKGLNMATSHEVVGVLAGVYIEQVTWPASMDVTLRGINKATVTLEAPSGQRGIILTGVPTSQTITIESLTITKANLAANGGGIFVEAAISGVHLKNLIVSNNTVTGSGGGLYVNSSSSNIALEGCTFTNNVANASVGDGSAIFTKGTTLISNCMIKNNDADHYAAVMISASSPMAYIYATTFEGNVSSNMGGGLYNEGVPVTLEACTFNNNSAPSGGAVEASTGVSAFTHFKRCVFINNHATSGYGAAIDAASLLISEKCLYYNNTAESGGGAIYLGGSAVVNNCIFNRNIAKTASGGAIYYTGAASSIDMHIVNCTFVSNEASTFGSAIHITNNGAKIMNSIFYNNKSSPAAINNAAYDLLYSDYDFTPLGATLACTTNDAVAFNDYPTDLHLSSLLLCPVTITEGGTFEALGILAPTDDLDGINRTIPYSMGAYEKD